MVPDNNRHYDGRDTHSMFLSKLMMTVEYHELRRVG